MSVTDRCITVFLPLVLACGGCSTTALFERTEPITLESASAGEAPAVTDAELGRTPQIVRAEAALVRETALRRGWSTAAAQHFEQALIDAPPEHRAILLGYIYAQLGASEDDTAEPAQEVPNRPQAPSPDAALRLPGTLDPETMAPPANTSTTSSRKPNTAANPNRSAQATADSGADPPPAWGGEKSTDASTKTSVQSALRHTISSTEKRRPPDLSAINTEATPRAVEASPSDSSDSDESNSDSPPSSLTSEDSDTREEPAAFAVATRDQGRPLETRHESAPEPQTISWQKQLRLAISRLRQDLESESLDEIEYARLRACLGLLQLATEDPEQAMEALDGFDDQQLEFWRQTIMGLGILLDSDELPKLRYRVDSATEHLQKGVSSLATLGPLRLGNLAFCTKVEGYGSFVECNPDALQPGKPVLLYVEVENFDIEQMARASSDDDHSRSSRRQSRSVAQPPMYETELHGRYEILDMNQRTIVSRTLPVDRNRCRNHRRDYFIPYMLYMPDDIAPGSYMLELTVEDKKGDKFGNAVIDFRIR